MKGLLRHAVVFEESAAEFILGLPRRRQRKAMDICYVVADSPHAPPDYITPDSDGRPVSHILTQGFLISYWVDSAVRRVVVVEIEDVG